MFHSRCMLSILFLSCLAGILPSIACADDAVDEIAPGYRECFDKAQRGKSCSRETQQCMQKAVAYWEDKVQAQYQSRVSWCKVSGDKSACVARLEKSKRAWMAYRDAAIEVYSSGYGRPFALEFRAKLTREFYESLGMGDREVCLPEQ